MSQPKTDPGTHRMQQIGSGLSFLLSINGKGSVSADHEEIFAGADVEEYTSEQKAQMDRFGWHWNIGLDSWGYWV